MRVWDEDPALRAAREIALYERLRLTEKEIRDVCLVKILPNRVPGDIGVSIRNATPEDIGKYCCLSYECGPQDEHLLLNISIINESQGTSNPCAIGPNLYSFLEVAQNGLSGSKAANLTDFHSDFWIDALSIDQLDPDVKNREVAKMGKIYAQASKTVIWLGHMGKPEYDWEAKYNNDKEELFKIVEAQSYWDRAWIVQEVALSREPVVLMRDFALPYDKIFAMNNTNDGRIYNFTYLIRHEIREEDSLDIILTLHALMLHKCKIAHDHIYSIRSITEAYSAIPVDYDTSHAEVVYQVFEVFPEKLCWCSLWLLLDLLPVRQYSASDKMQRMLQDDEWDSTMENCSQNVCQLKVKRFLTVEHPANNQKHINESEHDKVIRYSHGPFIEFTLETEQQRLSGLKCGWSNIPLDTRTVDEVLEKLEHTEKTFVNRDGVAIQRSLNKRVIRIALWAIMFAFSYKRWALYNDHLQSAKYGMCLKNGDWEFHDLEEHST